MIKIESSDNEVSETEYEVEEIVGRKTTKFGIRYKVKWVGYGPEECSWEPLIHLVNSIDSVKAFEMDVLDPELRAFFQLKDMHGEDDRPPRDRSRKKGPAKGNKKKADSAAADSFKKLKTIKQERAKNEEQR